MRKEEIKNKIRIDVLLGILEDGWFETGRFTFTLGDKGYNFCLNYGGRVVLSLMLVTPSESDGLACKIIIKNCPVWSRRMKAIGGQKILNNNKGEKFLDAYYLFKEDRVIEYLEERLMIIINRVAYA